MSQQPATGEADSTSPPATTTLSVLVPARGAAQTLPATLDRLLAEDYPGRFEVLVACPPQDTATRAVLAPYADDPRVRCVDNPTGGTSAALNAALAAAEGQIIVRVDAHALPPAGHLRRCAQALAATGAGNVGGPQVPVADGGFARAVADAMRSPFGSGGATYRHVVEPGPADTVYLGAFRREALEQVGGFDETLRRNQDYELNWRLRQAGWIVWCDPGLGVAYRPRESPLALARQYASYGRWKRVMLLRHPRSLKLRQLAAPALVAALTASAAGAAATGSAWPLLVPAGYLTAVLITGGIAARSLRRAPPTAAALGIMHVSWGAGFLFGWRRAAGEAACAGPYAGRR